MWTLYINTINLITIYIIYSVYIAKIFNNWEYKLYILTIIFIIIYFTFVLTNITISIYNNINYFINNYYIIDININKYHLFISNFQTEYFYNFNSGIDVEFNNNNNSYYRWWNYKPVIGLPPGLYVSKTSLGITRIQMVKNIVMNSPDRRFDMINWMQNDSRLNYIKWDLLKNAKFSNLKSTYTHETMQNIDFGKIVEDGVNKNILPKNTNYTMLPPKAKGVDFLIFTDSGYAESKESIKIVDSIKIQFKNAIEKDNIIRANKILDNVNICIPEHADLLVYGFTSIEHMNKNILASLEYLNENLTKSQLNNLIMHSHNYNEEASYEFINFIYQQAEKEYNWELLNTDYTNLTKKQKIDFEKLTQENKYEVERFSKANKLQKFYFKSKLDLEKHPKELLDVWGENFIKQYNHEDEKANNGLISFSSIKNKNELL